MTGPELIVYIVKRGAGDKLAALCRSEGISFSLILHGRGVYGGSGGTDRDVVLLSADSARAAPVMTGLFNLIVPDGGEGVAFMLPFAGLVSQQLTEEMFRGVLPVKKSEGRRRGRIKEHGPKGGAQMCENEYKLIITIVNLGFADDVMFAAKKAGAFGGTVLNARGTGAQEQKRFFGTVIEPEKEMVLIVAERDMCAAIMERIGRDAGLSHDGMGICFSLPVDAAIGLKE